MINFEKAFRFPFQQKNWKETVGVFFLITFVLAVLTAILQTVLDIPIEVLTAYLKESNSPILEEFLTSAQLSTSLIQTAISILTFPITLYLSGYVFDVVRHVINSKQESITPHGNYRFRIKLGAVKMLIAIVVGLVITIPAIFPILMLIAGALVIQTVPLAGALLLFLSGLVFLLWVVFAVFYGRFSEYSIEYLYLTQGYRNMFSLSKISQLIKRNWKKYMILLGVDFAGGIVIATSIFSCCLIFLVQPLVSTWVTFVLAYCYGTVYKSIYNTKEV